MAGEAEAAATLQNILDELCISTPTEDRFFRELEGLIAATTWPATADPTAHGKAAQELAIQAVTQVAPALYCQGPALDAPSGLSNLARLRSARKYYKYLPPKESTRFLDEILKTEDEFESASASEIKQWIEDHLRAYSGSLNLG